MISQLKMIKNTTWLEKSGYTNEEQVDIYLKTLQDVINHPRYFLDNLDFIPEYRVYFGNYDNSRKNRNGITNNPKIVQKRKK